jgi:hypothetical protein
MGRGRVGMSWKRTRRQVGLAAGLASLIVLFAFAGLAQAASVKAHNWPNSPVRHTLHQKVGATTPSFAANLRGGVAVAGNTLETCPANLTARARQKRGKAAHSKTRGARDANEPCVNDYNNGQNMQYVNVDPGDGRFNSSTATVTVPAGATVVKAFLYWAADLTKGVSDPGQPRNTGHDAPGGNTPQGQSFADPQPFPPTQNSKYGTVEFRAGLARATRPSTRSTRRPPRPGGTRSPAGIPNLRKQRRLMAMRPAGRIRSGPTSPRS